MNPILALKRIPETGVEVGVESDRWRGSEMKSVVMSKGFVRLHQGWSLEGVFEERNGRIITEGRDLIWEILPFLTRMIES